MPAQIVQLKNMPAMQHESVEQFRAHLATVKAVAGACSKGPAACIPDSVGADERVDAKPDFVVHWQWLRESLQQASKADVAQREKLMQAAGSRLDEMVQESAQPGAGPTADFAQARKDADRILSGAEFAAVDQGTWLDRQVARFWDWVGRVLNDMGNLGSGFPWLGRVLEVVLFGGAAVGLMIFVRRSLLRQRLAVALGSQAGELAWTRESTDWAAQAEGSARKGDWRDAVHCLYWATIVMLEGRRAWRHNPARTPREYVRLLKPGSAQQGALRGLTQIFERLWYGLRDAGPGDYERARSLYENLRDNAAAGAA